MAKIVHLVGTGTIGEPLIGLFTDFREKLGIDEVTFHKRTALPADRAKINHLMARGAKVVERHRAGVHAKAGAAAGAGLFRIVEHARHGQRHWRPKTLGPPP